MSEVEQRPAETTVGPYVLGRTIGRGSNGKVKEGYHTSSRMPVRRSQLRSARLAPAAALQPPEPLHLARRASPGVAAVQCECGRAQVAVKIIRKDGLRPGRFAREVAVMRLLDQYVLRAACCLLPAACCLLPAAYCLLLVHARSHVFLGPAGRATPFVLFFVHRAHPAACYGGVFSSIFSPLAPALQPDNACFSLGLCAASG
jgi:hypothetical protein